MELIRCHRDERRRYSEAPSDGLRLHVEHLYCPRLSAYDLTAL
jgi:hypothetical protein